MVHFSCFMLSFNARIGCWEGGSQESSIIFLVQRILQRNIERPWFAVRISPSTNPFLERCAGAGKLVMVPSGILASVSKSLSQTDGWAVEAPKRPILRFLVHCVTEWLFPIKNCQRMTKSSLFGDQIETKGIKWSGAKPFLIHSHLSPLVARLGHWSIRRTARCAECPSAWLFPKRGWGCGG